MTRTEPPSVVWTGMSSAHCMVNSGAAVFDSGGRFSQIWKSSNGLGASSLSSGNISECVTPRPVVSHWASPWP